MKISRSCAVTACIATLVVAAAIIAVLSTSVVSATTYTIFTTPSKITLKPGSTTIIDVYASPGNQISGARLVITLYNTSVANITRVTKGEIPSAFMDCEYYRYGNVLVVKCAIASFQPCGKSQCKILSLTVKGVNPGSTKINITGTVGLYSGQIYPVGPVFIPITVKSPVKVAPPPPPVTHVAHRCVIRLIPEYKIMYLKTPDMVKVVLANCSNAAGITVKISYNATLAKVIKVVKGPFSMAVGDIFKTILKPGEVVIGVVGTEPCGSNFVKIATIEFYPEKPGTLYISGSAEVALANGTSITAQVVPLRLMIKKYMECDLNHNGKLDIGDVVLLLKVALHLATTNVPCDLNHNGRIDIGDVVLLLLKVMKLLSGS